jgi:signal transduction histidine kinase
MLPPGDAKKALDEALDHADQAILEGRNAIQNLRASTAPTNELAQAIATFGEEFGKPAPEGHAAELRVSVEGKARELNPIVRDDVCRIAREALRNAFQHSHGSKIEAEITYSERFLRVRIRDNGAGIDPKVLTAGRDGHWGLQGMRERAQQIGGQMEIWSQQGAGTEVDLSIPSSAAYSVER